MQILEDMMIRREILKHIDIADRDNIKIITIPAQARYLVIIPQLFDAPKVIVLHPEGDRWVIDWEL